MTFIVLFSETGDKDVNITPRNYQNYCLQQLKKAREEGKKKALVVMASGLGKTLTGAFDIQRFFSEGHAGRILVLCHSAAILEQIRDVYQDFFGEKYSFGMYNSYEKTDGTTDFLFANLQSVNAHLEDFGPHDFAYIIVDEAHHAPAVTYRRAIEHFEPDFLLGMTATPDRMDNADITEIFGEPVFSYPLEDAVRDGWLSPVEYCMKTDDLQNMDSIIDSGRKISLSQLNREIFAPKRDEEIAQIIKEEIKKRDNPTTVIFCQTIAHAEEFAKVMGDAVVIHSKMSYQERQDNLAGFRNGTIRTVCAVDILNEGIDVPRTDVIVFLRVTQSKVVFTQQLGRGLRRVEGKDDVLVLDFVSTADRIEMIFQMETEFQSGKKRFASAKTPKKRSYFTLDVDSPVFRERRVDIMELIRKARRYHARTFYSRKEIIDGLKKMADELGRTPTYDEVEKNPDMPSLSYIRSAFDSFNEALKSAGLTVNAQKHPEMSRHEIVAALQKKSKELGHTPTQREVTKDALMPGIPAIHNIFGTYNNALEAAGLPVKMHYNYSAESITALLKEKAKELGRTPTAEEINRENSMPSVPTIRKVFGSYGKALEAAGLQKNQHTRPTIHTEEMYTEEILTYLKEKAKELGRTPKVNEVRKDVSMPSYYRLIKIFGTYNKALEAAGLPLNRRRAS